MKRMIKTLVRLSSVRDVSMQGSFSFALMVYPSMQKREAFQPFLRIKAPNCWRLSVLSLLGGLGFVDHNNQIKPRGIRH